MVASMTAADWIERIATVFETSSLHFGHGTDNARDEAAWLVLHVLDAPLDGSFDDWGRVVSESRGAEIDRLARARSSSGKPLAYVIGEARFAGLEFEVSPDVLVPRSPIAELILDGFRPWADPARVRRNDPGDPDKCPVWQFHLIYSDIETQNWVQEGCRNAGIGCVECKQPIIDAVLTELVPIRERARQFEEDPQLVRNILQQGGEAAGDVADETLNEVKSAIGLKY